MLHENTETPEDLLTEPDLVDDEEETVEQSVVSGIAGATTPLGTGATYPKNKARKKSKGPSRKNETECPSGQPGVEETLGFTKGGDPAEFKSSFG